MLTRDAGVADPGAMGEAEGDDVYKPRVTTWGMFPRPADISKAVSVGFWSKLVMKTFVALCLRPCALLVVCCSCSVSVSGVRSIQLLVQGSESSSVGKSSIKRNAYREPLTGFPHEKANGTASVGILTLQLLAGCSMEEVAI